MFISSVCLLWIEFVSQWCILDVDSFLLPFNIPWPLFLTLFSGSTDLRVTRTVVFKLLDCGKGEGKMEGGKTLIRVESLDSLDRFDCFKRSLFSSVPNREFLFASDPFQIPSEAFVREGDDQVFINAPAVLTPVRRTMTKKWGTRRRLSLVVSNWKLFVLRSTVTPSTAVRCLPSIHNYFVFVLSALLLNSQSTF